MTLGHTEVHSHGFDVLDESELEGDRLFDGIDRRHDPEALSVEAHHGALGQWNDGCFNTVHLPGTIMPGVNGSWVNEVSDAFISLRSVKTLRSGKTEWAVKLTLLSDHPSNGDGELSVKEKQFVRAEDIRPLIKELMLAFALLEGPIYEDG